jgi:methyl-accepting chemotaxis protein
MMDVRNVPVAVKLIGGFLGVAFIALVVGLIGWRGATQIDRQMDDIASNHLPRIDNLLTMKAEIHQLVADIKTLLNPELNQEQRETLHGAIAQHRVNYKKSFDAFEARPMSPEISAEWKHFLDNISAWKKENDLFLQASSDLEKTGILNPRALLENIQRFRGDHYNLMNKVDRLLSTVQPFEGGENAGECGLGKWMASYKTPNPVIQEALQRIAAVHSHFHENVKIVKNRVQTGDMETAAALFRNEMKAASESILDHFRVLVDQATAASVLYSQMNKQAMETAQPKERSTMAVLEKIVTLVHQEAEAASKSGDQTADRTKLVIISGMVGGFLVALVLGTVLALTITRALKRVIQGLSTASDQVASASTQVSSASHELSEGASEQAAAIEETSSSMEEMASMTRQNAHNAAEADQLIREARKIAAAADGSMSQLTQSMSNITEASEETRRIIKTIDEIAFQTNLLALNAAVEAARAGAAGAGFAVVADEVRNLAMRAAEAAKNTANLIEETMERVQVGSELVRKTNSEFDQVAGTVSRSCELVAEISAACQEQAQGIGQMSSAILQIEQVLQRNALGAEETTAASQEMSAQAEKMKDYVQDLETLVWGRASETVVPPPVRREKGQASPLKPAKKQESALKCRSLPERGHNGKATGSSTHPPVPNLGHAKVQLPPHRDEFSDF